MFTVKRISGYKSINLCIQWSSFGGGYDGDR